MGKTLVTGATGLLGAHLTCSLLQRGTLVVALKREHSTLNLFYKVANLYGIDSGHPLLQWVIGDLEDVFSLEKALAGIDVVFHCAAYVSFYKSDAAKMMHTNVQGTANLVDAAVKCNTPYFLHVSSIAALGRNSDQHTVINEETTWSNGPLNTNYAVSKHLSEMEVWRGFEEGLSGSIVNPGIILGAGDGTSGSNMFFHRINKGLKFFPTGTNGFVSVEDTVKLMLKLADEQVQHQRYVAISENYSYKRLLANIARTCGKPEPIIPMKGVWFWLFYILVRATEPVLGKRLPLSSENILVSRHSSFYDNQKALALGITFEPLSDTIKRCAQQLGLNA
ncbi:MAG: hypothetical protein RL160_75 [Bacteroidota bacterium]|jgi:nucleoside-diphosphate-sugar epimerase